MQRQDIGKIIKNTIIALIILVVFCFAVFLDLSGVKFKKNKNFSNVQKQELSEVFANAVQKNWQNVSLDSHYAEILVNVSPKGDILYIQPLSNSEYTQYAVNAIMKSSPFRNLPIKTNNDITVSFHFDKSGVSAQIMTKQEDTLMTVDTPRYTMVFCTVLDEKFKPDLNEYAKIVEKQINKSWNPPKISNSRVVVDFKINKNGNTEDIHISNSSKNPIADLAALQAIKQTNFSPLPENFLNESAGFRYFFMVVQDSKNQENNKKRNEV